MTVFDFDDYKAFLKHVIAAHSAVRGYRLKLAQAAGCKPSYFSQALSGSIHLTPDHAAGLANALQLTPIETDFFIELVHRGRAGSRLLIQQIDRRLQSLRERHETTTARVLDRSPEDHSQMPLIYYSSWTWVAVHIALSVEDLQTTAALSQRFGLAEPRVKAVLSKLREMGLAEESGGRWTRTVRNTYLSGDSELTEMNHSNWRQRAILDVQKGTEGSIHYTSVFGISRSDVPKLRRLIMSFIENSRQLIGPSDSEEVYCFACDCFRI